MPQCSPSVEALGPAATGPPQTTPSSMPGLRPAKESDVCERESIKWQVLSKG